MILAVPAMKVRMGSAEPNHVLVEAFFGTGLGLLATSLYRRSAARKVLKKAQALA